MNNSSNKYVQLVGGFIAIVFGVLQGIDWLFKKYEINSFYFNIILIVLLLAFIFSIYVYFVKRKNSNPLELRVGNPSGVMVAGAIVEKRDNQFYAKSAIMYRTFRPLMRGEVLV